MRNFSCVSSKMCAAAALAVILAAVFVSYLPVLKAEFILWDDDVHILNNIFIRSLDAEHLKDIFTRTVNKTYIPLTSLSFAIEYRYFGYNPFVYHLDNLILHLGVTAMVFALARCLGLSIVGAGVAALLFGIHPMRVESVAWATERKDVLYAVFYLAALMSYLRYLDKRRPVFLVLTTLWGVFSMLAKPMALSLPLVLGLLDWFKKGKISRRDIWEKVPLGLVIAGLSWITYAAHARVPGERLAQSLLIWPWTFTFYLRQFLFPFFSVPIYSLPRPVAFSHYEYALSLGVLLFMIISVVRLRKYRWFLFAVLFYFLSIFFLLRFDDLKDISIVADRFMYLPGLGFCLLVGVGLDRLWQKRKDPKGKTVLAGALGVFFVLTVWMSLKTYRQCLVWKDTVSLWQYQLKYYPDEAIALNNLAFAVEKQPSSQDAQETCRRIYQLKSQGLEAELSDRARQNIQKVKYIEGLYRQAIEARPNFKDAFCNLGGLYTRLGRIPEAVAAYKSALEVDYKSKDAHFGLGDLYVKAGDVSQAVYAYSQALRFHGDEGDMYVYAVRAYTDALKKTPGERRYIQARADAADKYAALVNAGPLRAGAYFSLGLMYSEIGDSGRAVSAYQRALDINPRHSGAFYNLGNIYKDRGDVKTAVLFYEKAVAADPRMSDAYLNIGIIYGRQGNEDAARKYYQKAIKADGKNAKAYFNMGYLEEQAGRFVRAAEMYSRSVQWDPKSDKGLYNLGNVFVELGRLDEAKSSYLKAVAVNPGNVDALANLSVLSFRMKDFAGALRYCDEAILQGYDAPGDYLKALEPYRAEKGTTGLPSRAP